MEKTNVITRKIVLYFENGANENEILQAVENNIFEKCSGNISFIAENSKYKYMRPNQFLAKQLNLKDAQKYKRGSYYGKEKNIKIQLPNGEIHNGKIRIANHRSSLKNWFKDKFGVSIVISSKPYPKIKNNNPKGVYVYMTYSHP